MKNTFYLLSLLLFLSMNLYAEGENTAPATPPATPVTPPVAEVIKLHGSAIFDNHELKVGDKIDKVGTIELKDKSFVQLKVDKWKNNISIGANSIMVLNFSDEKKYTLEKGICRWKSFARSEIKGKIYTKNSSMGVRGTDFVLKSNIVLGETEIYMFDGEVHFENLADKSNAIDIKKGQWGGLGGRFGQKINPPLDLPNSVLESMEKVIE